MSRARLVGTTLVALALAGALSCAGVGDSSDCKPACSGGKICCTEPDHNGAALPDGGRAISAPVCVTPSGGVCPTLP